MNRLIKIKKIYLILITLLVIIFATSNEIIALTSGAAKFDTLYVGIPEHDAVYGRPALYYYTMDGAMAYCIEMAVPVKKTEYSAYPYNDPRIGYALAADHGYTSNVAANFQIRQAVIWALLGQINIENLYAGDPGCVQAAKNLYYAAASYTGATATPNLSTNSLTFEIQGMYYVSNPITVSRGANTDSYDINLASLPAGSFISDVWGNPISTANLVADTTFQVRIPLEAITYDITEIDLSANAKGNMFNTTTAYNSIGVVSQALLASEYSVSPTSASSRLAMGRPIRAIGNMEVRKEDEYGNPISGTTFRVVKGSTNVTEVTDENGIATFEGLPAGTYIISETNASEGYYNDRTDMTQNIVTGITVSTSKVNRSSKGRISIKKEDSLTGNIPQGDAKLSGAVYKIYAREDIYSPTGATLIYSAGQEVGTCTTGENGISNSVDLPLGNYMYKEITPSEGYLLNPNENNFTIKYEGQDIEFIESTHTTTEQVKINDIQIIKKLQRTDSTPQTNLAGAKFSATLKSDTSKVYYSNETDESGFCIIENLPYGLYTIEEIVVPDTALKIDNFDVFIEQDSSEREAYTYTKENVAKKMQIKIFKEDIETGSIVQGDAHLEGAEYTLYRDSECTDAIETITIEKQSDGTYSAISGWYLVGTYYLKETRRPEGYLIDENVYSVTQIPANQSDEFSYHSVTSKDLVEKGDIYIVKYKDNNTNTGPGSTTKDPATGVELTLSLNSNPNTKYTATINEIGYADFTDIPYGWYTITETKSLEFVDIMEPQAVYIAYDNQRLHYIFQDARYERKLKIIKTDSETGRTIPIAGSTFKVWDVAAKQYIKQTYNYPVPTEIEEFVTTNDGTLVLPDGLIPGEYELEEIVAPYGYVKSQTRIPFVIEATTPENPVIEQTISIEFPNKPQMAALAIFKRGDMFTGSIQEDDITRPVYEERGLEGVEYTIEAAEDIITPDGTVRMKAGDTVTFVTGEDGIGKSQDLYLGKYTIRESKTIPGYIIQSEEISFVLEYKGQEIERYENDMDYINVRQKIKLKLRKKLEESKFKSILDNAYKDVVLGVYAKEDLTNYKGETIIPKDTLVDKLYITEEGNSTQNYDLPLGEYYVRELETNKNYMLNEGNYDFSFITNDNTTAINTVNLLQSIENNLTTLGKFRLYKYSEEPRNIIERVTDFFTGYQTKTHALSGAKFKLYYDDNGVAKELFTDEGPAEYVTGEDGTFLVEDLPFGNYYYQEIEAPTGYELDDTLYEFTIAEDHVEQPLEVEAVNKLIEIKLFTKVDAFNSQPIPNCTFEITDDTDTVIFSNITDENGDYYMPIDLLEVGKKYYYQEITAPEIFELNTDKHEFTLNEDFTPSITTVDNLRKISTIRLSKTDLLGGNKIANCTFELRSEEIDFVVNGTTDENGEYYFENIPYGTYTYTELSAPEEYIIDTTPHRIIVDEEIEEINVSNELRVNTSDINVMLFTILLIASSIGIIYIFYSKKELIKEKINKNK